MKFDYEVVEVCPHCDSEVTYGDWDVSVHGFVAVCPSCGKQIHLCDECMHQDDNPNAYCDWRYFVRDGNEYGVCFRGTTVNKEE